MSTQRSKNRSKTKGSKTPDSQSRTPAVVPEEVNAALEAKMLELEVQLQKKSEDLFEIVKAENLYKHKLLTYKEDLKEDKERHLAVCSNLVRQHKALQLSYTDQLNTEDLVLQEHRRSYGARTSFLKHICASRDKDLVELDGCLRAMKSKMDKMSEEFARLLTEIQVVMAHRIQSPLLDRTDQVQHFNEVLESSKAEYFKKIGELIREREDKHTVGTSWKSTGKKVSTS